MDQNSSNSSQADTSLSGGQNTTQAQPAATAQTATSADQTTSQIEPAPENQNENYVENVGESLVILLDDVNTNEKLMQAVANEMRLDVTHVKSILTGLMSKIDNGQITTDELALLMAVSVVDEPSS